METIASPKHLQQHLLQQQQQTQKGVQGTKLQTKRVTTQPVFEKFKPTKLQVPPTRPKFAKGFLVEFKVGKRMVHELVSFAKGSRVPTTQTSTLKTVEEVAVEVMKVDKAIELFYTMAIMNLDTGNLTLEVNIIKKILFMGEKEKVMLQEEMDKEKDFQKGYKQNVEIWRKNRVEAEQTNKLRIKKLQDENEELKG